MTRRIATAGPAKQAAADMVPKNSVLYLRVSSKRQMDTATDVDPDGNSIATQREHTIAKAASMDAQVVEEFVEPGTSAQTIEKRTVFRQMLTYLKQHPEIDYVIVYARSRAFRNFHDAAITTRWLDQLGVKLISAREDFGEGIMARAMEGVTDIMNDVQNKLSGQDISTKMKHKAQNGGTLGPARLGYLNARVSHEGRLINTIVLDPERAPLVHTAWELYATGEYSLDRLYAAMADQGLMTRPTPRHPLLQPVSANKLHQMLRDPYYAGYVVYKGETYPGRHEAIVDQQLFDRVQDVLSARSGNGQRDRVLRHYLKGLLFCDRCRKAGRTARLIYTEAKGRNDQRYTYFLCRARQDGLCDLPYLKAAAVEKAVLNHYATLRLAPDFITNTRAGLTQVMDEEQETMATLHKGFRKQLRDLEVREERLLDLAESGELPQAKIRARLRKVEIDRRSAQQGLDQADKQLATGAAILRQYLELLEDPQELYRCAGDDARRLIGQSFYTRLHCDDHGRITDEKQPAIEELIGLSRVLRFPGATDSEGVAEGQSDSRRPSGTNRGPSMTAEASSSVDPRIDSLGVTDDSIVIGSSKAVLVDLRGPYYNTNAQVRDLERLVKGLTQQTSNEEPVHLPRRRPRTAKQLNAEQTTQLIAGYQAGAELRELGAQFGIHSETAGLILRRNGIEMRPSGLSSEQVVEAERLYATGLH